MASGKQVATRGTRGTNARKREERLRAVGYCRVSTERQREDGQSVEDQQRWIRERAEREDWQLVDVLVDAGTSGGVDLAEREAGGRLVRLVEDGKVDVVMVREPSRLGRNALAQLTLLEGWEKRGVRVLFLSFYGSEDFDTASPHGRMFRTMLLAVDQYAREQTKIAMLQTYRRRKAQGLPTGTCVFERRAVCPKCKDRSVPSKEKPSRCICGGQMVEKPCPVGLATLGRIHELTTQDGYGYRRVAHQLDEELRPTPKGGPKWSFSSVRNAWHRLLKDKVLVESALLALRREREHGRLD